VLGLVGQLGDGPMLRQGMTPLLDVVAVRREHGLLLLPRQNLSLQGLCALAAAIPDVEGDDLACLLIHSEPDPVWSGLPLHEAPQLICLNL
jgi:hypothetical protein